MNPFFPFCPENHVYLVSEPSNAITSILMGAVGVFILVKHWRNKNWQIKLFGILIINIGLQSAIMHARPSTLTTYLDLSSLILFGIYLVYLVKNKIKTKQKFGNKKYTYYLSLTLLIGAAFWLADIFAYYCPVGFLPTGHAIWHTTMAIALWHLYKFLSP